MRLIGPHPADRTGDLPRSGAGEQPRPGRQRPFHRREYGYGEGAGVHGRAHARLLHDLEHGGSAGAVAPGQRTVGDRQPGAAPHPLRQRLEHGGRGLRGQLVQQPVGPAAVPERACHSR